MYEVTDDVDRVVVLADFMHTDNVRVLQLCCCASVPEEQLSPRFIRVTRDLDCDRTVQLGIVCPPDTTELANFDPIEQLKTPDRLSSISALWRRLDVVHFPWGDCWFGKSAPFRLTKTVFWEGTHSRWIPNPPQKS